MTSILSLCFCITDHLLVIQYFIYYGIHNCLGSCKVNNY